MIHVEGLRKVYRVARRDPGLRAALASFVRPRFSEIEALRDLSFDVAQGEIVGYIGPNGAGKSTTIKALSGILVPDAGTCVVDGRIPWKDRKNHVREIGVVFGQRTQLWWDVPAEDSFELLREIYSVPRDKYKANRDMVVDMLGLWPFLGVPVRQLSLGQRARCEIAASLLHGPRILFLDEPTIGLDAPSKLALRAFINALNAEKGLTVVITTHDMNDIEALADRILMIGKGSLLFDGDLESLRAAHDPGGELTAEELAARLYEAHGL
jgi:ABC-2 type transport system ATP-binding protein